MRAFAAATLAPVVLLGLGILFGGPWAAGALVYMTVLSFTLDRLIARALPEAPEGAEFPAADALSAVLALAHLALVPAVVWAVAGDSGLSGAARVALAAGAGLWFGQVSNSNAHELIHRSDRRLYRLGVAVYVSLLYGQHVSAHRLVHHRHVATDADPNSARRGESFYAFAARAWPAEFRAGRAAESALRKGRGLHPYAVYLGGAALWVAGIAWAFGWRGLLVYLALAAYAQAQLLLSDYVQHYGLRRALLPSGRFEPVGPGHSWDARPPFTAALMLNAPRHADHHAHPARPYPALRLPAGAAVLPHGLPVMAVLALAPPVWFRLMDRRLDRLARAVPQP
ncbi:alkane 1-monooxygenase [Ruixingdingia sedimenti]|uniref:Alkane 1-monooxygenase n=1 Tax=Ruixingdingia sedimenti TaxID=3073604 RepID=A0ABU1F6J7_9RHOB|nr:alkane 1-monooxygenase [Xinfangfangia sp. LG-4]MDR5652501.1 alkane 1-monooxygenase [Xinfangfangia sp. LG-4]